MGRVWRCTGRPWLSEFGDALGGRDRATLEMHWEAVIEQVWRCTGRPWSREFEYALGGHNRASLEMHFEAVIKRLWRCYWRPRLSECRDILWGCDSASLEIHLQPMIERDWKRTCSWSIWRLSMGGVPGAETLFIGLFTPMYGNLTRWLYLWCSFGELAVGSRSAGKYTGSWSYIRQSTRNRENERTTDNLRCMLYSVHTVLGVCCTRCMLYSVYAVLGVCCTRCMLYSVYAVLGVCRTRCMLYSVYTVLGVCYTQCMLHSVLTHDDGMKRYRGMM